MPEIAKVPSPNEIALWLGQLIRQLDGEVIEFADLGDQAAAAKRDAEVAYARAFLSADGPVDVRKQMAVEYAADKRWAADVADRKVAACREAIRALHLKVEVGRTASANVRAELAVIGSSVGDGAA